MFDTAQTRDHDERPPVAIGQPTALPRLAALVSLLLLCCAVDGAGADPPAVLDAGFPEGRRTFALSGLLEKWALGPGEDMRLIELGRGETLLIAAALPRSHWPCSAIGVSGRTEW